MKHSDNREVFHCDCGFTEHMIVVDHHFWGGGDSEFAILPMLSKKTLAKRIGIAWRYLIGAQSRHGAFDAIILDDVDVRRLRKSCDVFLTKWEADHKEYLAGQAFIEQQEQLDLTK